MAILLLETALFLITGHVVLANNSNWNHEPLEDTTNAVLKSIQSEDGDIIDCVDIYKQPALNHPALRNHKIQMLPSYVPTMEKTPRKINRAKRKKNKLYSKSESQVSVTKQIWHKNGSCPEGTVPIRRNMQTMNKALPILSRRYNSSFNRSKHEFSQNNTLNMLRANHAMSILLTEGYAYTGAQGDIAVYNPTVEGSDEYTLSDVSLENGGQGFFEAIRSGWMVNPMVYGDKNTRFFTYWTADGAKSTGCFDSLCPGFVQVSKDIALGATIDHISSPSNRPSQVMSISIYKDQNTNNWWVDLGGKKIGYWPSELFEGLSHHAASVQWGGDVYSTRLTTPHTATAMGSGEYASPIDWLVGSIRGMRILQYSSGWKYPEWTNTYADQYDCYSFYLQIVADDPVFYYGGPGSGGPVSRCH
ncbi:OLC1v1029164C2 [Oldenlandia corymbosa var. corymbosa]|nr:OLC1v1029164C2 [Oldenlandia corymbosa var. corymbosa]